MSRVCSLCHLCCAAYADLPLLKVFDGFKPDAGDLLGGSICLLGAAVILFWPRGGAAVTESGGAGAGAAVLLEEQQAQL